MTVEGNLNVFQLPEILQLIAQQQKTGILTVQGEDDIIAVSFLKGKVVGADSLHHTSEERLARILVDQGSVAQKVVDDLLQEQASTGSRLQDLLIDGGHTQRAQLLAGLRQQYTDLLVGLLHWDQGDFKFYSNDEVSFEEGFEPLSVQSILLDAGPVAAPTTPAPPSPVPPQHTGPIPDLDDLGLTPPPMQERAPAASLPRLSSVFERCPADNAAVSGLSAVHQKVLQQIDGRATVAAVIIGSGLDEDETLQTLQLLQSQGLVQVRRAAPSASAPSPAQLSSVQLSTAQSSTASPGTAAAAAPVAAPAASSFDGVAEIELDGLGAADADSDMGAMPAPLLDSSMLPHWLSRGIACLAALWVVGLLWLQPLALSLPFPWQEAQREVFSKQQRKIAYFKIDRALKTQVLFTGQLPDDLGALIEGGLLPAAELRDPGGNLLGYQAGDGRYRLAPQRGGSELTRLGTTEAITGNFILDPEFFSAKAAAEEAPLVLLD